MNIKNHFIILLIYLLVALVPVYHVQAGEPDNRAPVYHSLRLERLRKVDTSLPAEENSIEENKDSAGSDSNKEEEENDGTDFIPGDAFIDLVIVGIAEGTLSGLSRTGDPSGIEEEEIFGDGFDADGRIAFYVKGTVLGKYGITASYDSEDPFRERLFEDLNPDRFYSAYGDGSNYYRDGQSRRRFFIKINLDKSYLMYGDFATGFTGNDFSSYNRTFPGIKTHYEDEKFNVTILGSHTGQVMTRDEIMGTGLSGVYHLTERELMEGSERIWIETRDRDIPELVISSVVKIRNQDYTIDYERGTIIFKEPVPTIDEFENPVYVIAQYECKGDEKVTNLGFRGDINFSPDFSAGVTYINENSSPDLQLMGIHSNLKINDRINLYGEYAHSHSLYGNDDAGKVELTANINSNIGINGFYRSMGKDFFNPSSNSLLERGSTIYGLEGKAFFMDNNLINISYINSTNDLLSRECKRTQVNYKRNFGPFQLNAGYVHRDYVSSDLSFNSHIANVGLKTSINSRLSLFANQEVEWMKENGSSNMTTSTTSLGAEYLLDNGVIGYLQYDFVRGDRFNDDSTILGFRSPVGLGENTQFFTQYNLDGARSGEKNQASIGLNTRVELFKGLKARLTYQRFIGNRDIEASNAISVALEFLENERFKGSLRYEIRSDETDRGKLISLYGSGNLTDDLSLVARYTYSDLNNFADRDFANIDSHFTLGLAYRPVWTNKFSLLAKYDLRRYRDTMETKGGTIDTLAHIAMLEGIYNISEDFEFYGKYAYKKEKCKVSGLTDTVDLFQGRLTYKFHPRLSLFGEARYLRYLDTGERTLASIVAVDYLLWENWMVEGGYVFRQFEEEFNLYNREVRSQGPYIKLLLKY